MTTQEMCHHCRGKQARHYCGGCSGGVYCQHRLCNYCVEWIVDQAYCPDCVPRHGLQSEKPCRVTS